MSGGKPLTAQLVASKTKSDNLHNIKNLNLWGNELEDLKLLREMTNLEVVSLSVNKVSTLKEFANLHKLQQLYLRKNNIHDLREIRYLAKLPQLKVLWLHDNPCALAQNYRSLVIKTLPNLVKLDNTLITKEERDTCRQLDNTIDDEIEYEHTPVSGKKQHDSPYKQPERPATSNYKAPELYDNRPIKNNPAKEYAENKYEERPLTAKNYADPDARPLNSKNYVDPDSRPLNGGRPATGQPAKNQSKWEQPRQNFSQHRAEELTPANRREPNYPTSGRGHSQGDHKREDEPNYRDMERNKNILMAVISLLRQLDENSLEVVRGQLERLGSKR